MAERGFCIRIREDLSRDVESALRFTHISAIPEISCRVLLKSIYRMVVGGPDIFRIVLDLRRVPLKITKRTPVAVADLHQFIFNPPCSGGTCNVSSRVLKDRARRWY